MNLRLEQYRTGACFFARHIYRGGGRRVTVLDPHIRARAAVRALSNAGHSPRAIGLILRRPTAFVIAISRTADTFFRLPKGALDD